MTNQPTQMVTGATGYSGSFITRRLLDGGINVRTLTNSPNRPNPFGDAIEIHPYNFDKPDLLTKSLEGVDVLYNTYWVRFNHKKFKHSGAVANTRILFDAATHAGVKRVVHVSITNPSIDSPLEYFSGKADLENALKETGISHAILRPGVIFGGNDILISNIAWMIRRFPIFGVFGDGSYRLQPVHVEDLADLAIEHGKGNENVIVNAIGPETFTYRELAETLADILGKKRLIIGIPPSIGYFLGWCMGKVMGDVVITREEIVGLMDDLLYVNDKPAGNRRLTDWARENANTIGKVYANELGRRKKTAPVG